MSEMTSVTVGNDKDQSQSKELTPMQQTNLALKECGFGWFHVILLCTSYVGFSAGVLVTNTVPYILPNAECDLKMDLFMKGLLTAIPFVGMCTSSSVAGFLTDTFGRKIFLVGGYGMIAFFNFISSLSQTYTVLLVSKFFEGFVFAAAFSPTMTFTAEFCYNEIRDRVMLLQSSFGSINQILLAALTWVVLTQDWQYRLFDGVLILNTWNFYLLILTVFSVASCILYSLLPESPKYLVGQHRYDEARDTLIYIYKKNTGKPANTFLYANLWKDRNKVNSKRPKNEKITFIKQLVNGLQDVKPLFRKPQFHNLLLFSSMYFSVMLLYNVIRMWYPQLLTIVEHYSSVDSQELCVMLDEYTEDLKLRSVHSINNNTSEVCVPAKSGSETYINSIILGFVCIPAYILSCLLINKVGKKRLFIAAGVISIAATLGLRWSSSKAEVVGLLGLEMAIGQVMKGLLQASSVEFFPTAIRTLGLSITMTSGRIGSLVGNLLFPILLNMGCMVPFFALAGCMICVTAMGFCLPNMKK